MNSKAFQVGLLKMNKPNIFPDGIKISQLNAIGEGCMIEHLGIELTEIGSDYILAKMPVDHRTKQPMGLLHGGANVALSESLASYASTLLVDLSKKAIVGLEINANHIRAVKEGFVYGKVFPLHIGRTTHVWSTEITNEEGKLVSVGRCTVAVIDQK